MIKFGKVHLISLQNKEKTMKHWKILTYLQTNNLKDQISMLGTRTLIQSASLCHSSLSDFLFYLEEKTMIRISVT